MKRLHMHCPYCGAPAVRRRGRDLFREQALAPEALYQLAVKGIVLHWYEQRNVTDGAAPTDFAAGVRLTINQLKQTCQLNSL